MSWNHRVLAMEIECELYYGIYEVYYDENGKPNGYSEKPVTVAGDTIDNLKCTLKRMHQAFRKPVLYEGERFPQEVEQ